MNSENLPTFSKSGRIQYVRHGDYYYPLIVLRETEDRPIGKYGLIRRAYLKEFRKAKYNIMLLQGTLDTHLADIDVQARERFDLLVEQMARTEGVTEILKGQDSMAWLRRMNNIRNRAEKIVLAEIVYGEEANEER